MEGLGWRGTCGPTLQHWSNKTLYFVKGAMYLQHQSKERLYLVKGASGAISYWLNWNLREILGRVSSKRGFSWEKIWKILKSSNKRNMIDFMGSSSREILWILGLGSIHVLYKFQWNSNVQSWWAKTMKVYWRRAIGPPGLLKDKQTYPRAPIRGQVSPVSSPTEPKWVVQGPVKLSRLHTRYA